MTDPANDFEKWGCPGAHLCARSRTKEQVATGRIDIFPCMDCEAPGRTIRDDGTIVYRSYADSTA